MTPGATQQTSLHEQLDCEREAERFRAFTTAVGGPRRPAPREVRGQFSAEGFRDQRQGPNPVTFEATRAIIGRDVDTLDRLAKPTTGATIRAIEERRKHRRHLHELRDLWRTHAHDGARDAYGNTAQWKCGRVSLGDVSIGERRYEDGTSRVGVRGVVTCQRAWGCPVCGASIRLQRAAELRAIQASAEEWGWHTYMVTLTVRHTRTDDLATLVRGINRAWAAVQRRALWRDAAPEYVRSMELTWGRGAGWHPHLHVMLWTQEPLNLAEWNVGRFHRRTGRLLPRSSIHEVWADAIERELGPRHRPSKDRGVDVKRCSVADYLSKLDLEITDAANAKRGKNGRFKPGGLLEKWGLTGEDEYAARYSEFCAAMLGRRFLTYSHGLHRIAEAVLHPGDVVEAREAVIPPTAWAEMQWRWWEVVEMLHDVEHAAAHDANILDAVLNRFARMRIFDDDPDDPDDEVFASRMFKNRRESVIFDLLDANAESPLA